MQQDFEVYLNKSVKPILEALAEAVVTDMPEDPVSILSLNPYSAWIYD